MGNKQQMGNERLGTVPGGRRSQVGDLYIALTIHCSDCLKKSDKYSKLQKAAQERSQSSATLCLNLEEGKQKQKSDSEGEGPGVFRKPRALWLRAHDSLSLPHGCAEVSFSGDKGQKMAQCP